MLQQKDRSLTAVCMPAEDAVSATSGEPDNAASLILRAGAMHPQLAGAWTISASELAIMHRLNGDDWLLGSGSHGAHRKATYPHLCQEVATPHWLF